MPTEISPDQSTPASTVETGVLCLGCQYELAGLPSDSVCPECGMSIARSLMGDTLLHADPQWLKKVYRGFRLIIYSVLVPLFFMITVLLGVIVFGLIEIFAAPNPAFNRFVELAETPFSVLFWIVIAASPLCFIFGWFCVTTPEPDRLDEHSQQGRRYARWTAVAWLLLSALGIAGISVVNLLVPNSTGVHPLIAWGVHAAASSLHYWFAMEFVRSLANRLPNPKLVRKARTERVGLVIATTLGMLACGLGPLIAFIMYLSILDTLRSYIKPIVARQALSATPPSPLCPPLPSPTDSP